MIAEKGTLLERWIRGRVVLPGWNEVEESFIDEKSVLGPWIERVYYTWADGSVIDREGGVWLDSDLLFPIVRVASIVDLARFSLTEHEQMVLEDRNFLRGQNVARVLDNVIRRVERDKCRRIALNAEIASELYLLIRNSVRARQQQKQFYDTLDETRQKMKERRLAKYRCVKDEITGEDLHTDDAEFVYVRMPSFYRELTESMENGFVVNPDTYSLIRSKFIADERELGRLCERKGWPVEWYNNFNPIVTEK